MSRRKKLLFALLVCAGLLLFWEGLARVLGVARCGPIQPARSQALPWTPSRQAMLAMAEALFEAIVANPEILGLSASEVPQ